MQKVLVFPVRAGVFPLKLGAWIYQKLKQVYRISVTNLSTVLEIILKKAECCFRTTPPDKDGLKPCYNENIETFSCMVKYPVSIPTPPVTSYL